jgi:hypothetical protein
MLAGHRGALHSIKNACTPFPLASASANALSVEDNYLGPKILHPTVASPNIAPPPAASSNIASPGIASLNIAPHSAITPGPVVMKNWKVDRTAKDTAKSPEELQIIPSDLEDIQPRANQHWSVDEIGIDQKKGK